MISRVERGTGSMRRSLASRSLELSSSSIAVRHALSIARARSARLTPRHEGASRNLGNFGPRFTVTSLRGPTRSEQPPSVLGLEVEVMDRFDKADRVRLRAHHDAVGHR